MTLHRYRFAAVLGTVAALILPAAPSAQADPDGDDAHSIEEELEQAIEDYVAAQDALEQAEEEQQELADAIEAGQEEIDRLSAEVADFAEAAYRSGGLPPATVVLTSGTPEKALAGLSVLSYVGEQNAALLGDLIAAQETMDADLAALDDAVDDAADALADKEKARDAAQREVDDAAGGPTSGNGLAEPAPRNPDGSWPTESCSLDDPSGTGGCVTPRMNHTFEQARAAGYDHYASCYRSANDGGDHPLGRACDFAADPGGFGGVAAGASRDYGDSLAGWGVANADALGIKYIIWFDRFWDPVNGWGPYSGGGTGNPASDHTNHVHISMLLGNSTKDSVVIVTGGHSPDLRSPACAARSRRTKVSEGRRPTAVSGRQTTVHRRVTRWTGEPGPQHRGCGRR